MEVRKAERTARLVQDGNILIDISESGACLRFAEKPVIGSEIRLEMSCKEKFVALDSKVVRTKAEEGGKTFQAGVHFLRLLEAQLLLVREIVDDFGRGVPISVRLVK